MAFAKTPGGSRGSKVPSFARPAVLFMNKQLVKRFRRSGGGRSMGIECLVLTTVGAKTGQKRQTLLGRPSSAGWPTATTRG